MVKLMFVFLAAAASQNPVEPKDIKECSLKFAGSLSSESLTVSYRTKLLMTFNNTSVPERNLFLPHPIPLYPQELRFESAGEALTAVRVTQVGVAINLGTTGLTVTLECKSWSDILSGSGASSEGDEQPADEAAEIAACVRTTSTFDRDDELGQPMENFLYRGNRKANGEKKINAAFLYPGLNINPLHISDYRQWNNGAVQGTMWYAEMCTQMVRAGGEFLLLFASPVYPQRETERFMYMDHGTLYTSKYMQQGVVDPIIHALSTDGYTVNVMFGGFSMGGIIATYQTIDKSGHILQDEVTKPTTSILDPYMAESTGCAKKAIKGEAEDVKPLRKKESIIDSYLSTLQACLSEATEKSPLKSAGLVSAKYTLSALYTLGSPINSCATPTVQPPPYDSAMTYENASSRGVIDATGPKEDGNGYINFIGRIIIHDGTRIRKLQALNPAFTVYHINHFFDNVVGMQTNMERNITTLGYMDSGDWSLTTLPPATEPEINFTCWFAERKGVASADIFPDDNDYSKFTDEFPYDFQKMMYDFDSEAVASVEPYSGPQHHHESFVFTYLQKPDTLGYFFRQSRLATVLTRIVGSAFSSDKAKYQSICTTTNPKVKVSRDGEVRSDGEVVMGASQEITKYKLKEEKVAGELGDAEYKNIEEGILECNWIGQEKAQPPYSTDVNGHKKCDIEGYAKEVDVAGAQRPMCGLAVGLLLALALF